MKILYHHRTLGDGAEGIHIAEMVNAFRELGHEVRIVSPIGGQTNVKNERITRLTQLKLLVPSAAYEILELVYNVYGYFLLRNAIREFHPNLIYDRYITFDASSILAGKRFKIPVILEVNAPLALERKKEVDEKLYLKRIAYYLEKQICANADKTVVVSTPLRDYLISIGVPQSKLVVLPNGVNLKKFHPEVKDSSLLKTLDISWKSKIFGFVGILRPWHGLDLLLNAFAEVSYSVTNCHLLIIGDGPVRQDLELQIKRLRLQGKVTITGRIPHEHIPRYVNLIDIAVSPMATFYASPMKILEYMALRKAVIAPDMPNIRDIIIDSQDGCLFKVGDQISLRDAMLKLAKDEFFRDQIAHEARKKVELERNWMANAEVILRLI